MTIRSIGIDSVEIARFAHWHAHSEQQLSRIFYPEEIAYCRASQAKSAERFAVRFAAKEALLKALGGAYQHRSFALLSVCKHAQVIKHPNGSVALLIDWASLDIQNPPNPFLSLTHTKTIATAIVFLT